jgi:DNA-binding response OmpR family regulator
VSPTTCPSPEAVAIDVEVQSQTPPSPVLPRAQLRVLLLDDQEDFRTVISEYLLAQHFTVTQVSNGAEGLRAILRETYDLIICDMMMPKVGGEMFYWAVTRVRPAARLRFIFITGHQNEPTIQHFFKRIDATVLVKPFMFDELNACLLAVDRKLR